MVAIQRCRVKGQKCLAKIGFRVPWGVPENSLFSAFSVYFGSVARGEAGPDSDVDLFVELKPAGRHPVLGLRWFELEEELAARLGRPVELVTEAALSPRLRPYVKHDGVVLYEEE